MGEVSAPGDRVQREMEKYFYHYQRLHLGLKMQIPLPLELWHFMRALPGD